LPFDEKIRQKKNLQNTAGNGTNVRKNI